MPQILGTRIDLTTYDQACDRIKTWIESGESGYVIPANVHVVMTGVWQPRFQTMVNEAKLVTADGMPLVWGLRLLGYEKSVRVYGPDLMLALCAKVTEWGWPIYLYGSEPRVMEQLTINLLNHYPNLAIAGSHCPPFRPLSPEEYQADGDRIRASGAKIIFVSLGCPKQEEWMYQQRQRINGIMLGVGAAFNFHSGHVRQAPRWMMALGLEWLFRLSQEPRRLAGRYLINNPLFLILFAGQWLHATCTRRKVNEE
ncbi:WecB/TagA/CpsF family glycosyltransferase [Candidatus Synechococcus calcipolaris G9]|uniref:WecB/TagA/CpsF family glycosyltransferase n=1 Tax=Candidatus Synechococcus calcipolaris G9 TaxID=1497997 RepID=A0ABT6EZ02_9SYNE|nr:WecB/TagA/CpsF family glycosyltransferase [Candidatus Synechococcus calcipolaris]MDG2990847.1 WecB/TagA/CpsF family glycosyltransferase [Candidatus Synechococcus calcipolaris G9]